MYPRNRPFNQSSQNSSAPDTLMEAVRKQDIPEIKRLLAQGLDVDETNKYEDTPLIWAATRGYEDIAALLLDHNADINKKNKYGDTPLTMAAHNGMLRMTRFLIARGADIDAKNNDGQTALSLAVRNSHSPLVSVLKEALEQRKRQVAQKLVEDQKRIAEDAKNAEALARQRQETLRRKRPNPIQFKK